MILVWHVIRSVSTHTVPLTARRILKLALFPRHLWLKQRKGAG